MTITDIVAAIHQAATDAMDHPYNGKEAGLERDEGNKITDSRVIDGFKVSVTGNILTIAYNRQVPLKKAKEEKYEQELENMLAQLASFIKKEFKNKTGKSLTLKDAGDMEAIFQNLSNKRSMVLAKKAYEIGNIKLENDDIKSEREKIVDDIELMESNSHVVKFRNFIKNDHE
jgi:hypothetical protein